MLIDSEQHITTTADHGVATFKLTDPLFKGSCVESVGFEVTEILKATILDIEVEGNITDQPVGAPAFAGGEGIGFALTIGRSTLRIGAVRTSGVGMFFSDGGNGSLYTHGNIYIRLSAAYTGQEGIVFSGGLDGSVEYAQSYFPWDSNRDTVLTQDKVSKVTTCPRSNGILFWRGSMEVQLIHPSNNRFGYAWGTGNQNYRLRFDHAIGEGSAGGAYLSSNDTVVGSLMDVHSTRGKPGLPLATILGGDEKNISQLHIRVDAMSGFPAEGTAGALRVDNERVQIDSVRINQAGGQMAVGSPVVSVDGGNHNMKISMYGFLNTIAATPAVGISFLSPSDNNEVAVYIQGSGVGVSGASGSVDLGSVEFTFVDCVVDIDPTYLGFLDGDFIRKNKWNNITTGRSTRPRTLSTVIPQANLDGTDRFFNINNLDDLMYQTPIVSGVNINGVSSSYRQSAGHVYQTAQTTSITTMRYGITGSGSDARVNVTIS